MRHRRRRIVAIVALLAGCASTPLPPDAAGTVSRSSIVIEGVPHEAHWYVPAAAAPALVLLQHGFSRHCGHLRETSRQLMAGGMQVLCIDAPMAAGNPLLADGLARWLVEAPGVPDAVVLPSTWIVAGHSAGGAFAARLGARLARVAPQRLAGALLFDPVATRSFEADLLAVSDDGRRPVLAVLAQPHGCNAELSAAPALRRVRAQAIDAGRAGFVGVQLSAAATHIDVEGEDSDWLARAACGEPDATNTRRLRTLAVRWAQQIALGVRPTLPAGDGWRVID